MSNQFAYSLPRNGVHDFNVVLLVKKGIIQDFSVLGSRTKFYGTYKIKYSNKLFTKILLVLIYFAIFKVKGVFAFAIRCFHHT